VNVVLRQCFCGMQNKNMAKIIYNLSFDLMTIRNNEVATKVDHKCTIRTVLFFLRP
jgi:hypothetical protein